MQQEKLHNSESNFYKNFVALFSGNSIAQAFPFLLAPFVARLYKPEQVAIHESFLSIASLISIIAAGRYEMAIVLPKLNRQASNLFSLAIIFLFGIAAIAFFLSLFPSIFVYFFKEESLRTYIILLSPAILFLGLSNIFTQWIIRARKYNSVSVSRIIQSAIQNLGYIILGYWRFGVSGLFLGWFAGIILSVLFLLLPTIKLFSKKEVTKEAIIENAITYKDFLLVNSVHAFTDILASQFLLYSIITKNFGAATLGLFAIMMRYSKAPLALISGVVSQLYYTEASRLKSENQSLISIFIKCQKIILVLLVPILSVILFFGPKFFEIYLGANWKEAGLFAQIMCPALLLNFLCSVVSTTPLVFNQQKKSYLFSLAGYTLSLGVLFFSALLKLSFITALIFYSVSLCCYYGSLLIWYYKLIHKNNQK